MVYVLASDRRRLLVKAYTTIGFVQFFAFKEVLKGKHYNNISFFVFFTFLLLIRKDVRQNILTFEWD